MDGIEVAAEFLKKSEGLGKLAVIFPTGSHAYGLATPESDYDYKGIFFPNERYIIGLDTIEQVKVRDDDWTLYEFRRFVKLLKLQNPSIIELLFSPDIVFDVRWKSLKDILKQYINQDVYLSYKGYIEAQLERIQRDAGGKRKELFDKYGYDVKSASHVCRLALQGIELLATGTLHVRLEGETQRAIMEIKTGKIPKRDVITWIRKLQYDLNETFKVTILPSPSLGNRNERLDQEIIMPFMKTLFS